MNTDQDPSHKETDASKLPKPSIDPGKERPKKAPSQAFVEFQAKVDATPLAETKIRLSLEFMKQALAFSGSPRFEDFWAARRFCIGFFKESLSPTVRTELWNEYLSLSVEAKRQKEIVDEQSAFAVEQIELAIQAVEKDLSNGAELLEQMADIPFPRLELIPEANQVAYHAIQRELHFLNTFASRISSLRKEVIKTGMRIRHKNQFFERLSALGDHVFPRRKELIKEVSDLFLQDMDSFIKNFFEEDFSNGPPLYVLREEIKALQDLAKILTLNTHAFTETRLKLSICWDKMKEQERERKKEIAQKRLVYKKNFDLLKAKIDPLLQRVQNNELKQEEVRDAADEISKEMRETELGREEVWALKDSLRQIIGYFEEKEREEEARREAREVEKEQKRKEKIDSLRKEMEALVERAENLTIEELALEREKFTKELEIQILLRAEKQLFEKLIKQMRDALTEKKEKAILELPPEVLHSLEQLKSVLEERKKMRQEIKEQLEAHRKAAGGSGFDFEKAMLYRELMETEKARLEKVNAAIEEIEEKIAKLEE